MPAEIVYLFDRRYWTGMEAAWVEGRAAYCPAEADPVEFRSSAKRLARKLGTTVRTGLHETAAGALIRAIANGGCPLGMTDARERDRWRRQATAANRR